MDLLELIKTEIPEGEYLSEEELGYYQHKAKNKLGKIFWNEFNKNLIDINDIEGVLIKYGISDDKRAPIDALEIVKDIFSYCPSEYQYRNILAMIAMAGIITAPLSPHLICEGLRFKKYITLEKREKYKLIPYNSLSECPAVGF